MNIDNIEIPKFKTLHELYEFSVRMYVFEFAKKQNLRMDVFKRTDNLDIVSFDNETYLFNVSDILYDIESKQQKGNIMYWEQNNKIINYKSWCIGLRFR